MAATLIYIAASGLCSMPPIPALPHAPVPTPALTQTYFEGTGDTYAPYDYHDNYTLGGLCFSFIF